MEQTNKLLMLLVALALIVIAYVVSKMDNVANNISKTSESMAQTMAQSMSQTFVKVTEDNNVVTPPHPYNECIKLLTDLNKANDLDKIKIVCSGLLDKEKIYPHEDKKK